MGQIEYDMTVGGHKHAFRFGVYYWKILLPMLVVLSGSVLWLSILNHNRTEQNTPTFGELSQAAREGDIETAVAGYDAYLAKADSDAERRNILVAKATAYMVSGLYTEAIESAEDAITIMPDDVLYGVLGDAYAATGDTTSATRYYTLAIAYADQHSTDTTYYSRQLEGVSR